MSNTLVLIAVLAAVAVSVLAAIMSRRRRNTATEVSSQGIRLDPVIGGFVDAAYQSASETEERYVRAVALLRQDPDKAAQQIETAYRSIGKEQIRMREALLFAAVALAHRSVLPLLVEVTREPVSGTVRHDGGRAAEESILRLIAVDGIEAIARAGDTEAADALLALAASPDRAVQAGAVVALKYADAHRGRYEKLRDVLTPDRLYLLDVVRTSVRDVPQILDARRHLRSEPTTVDTRPDLASGKRRNAGVPPSHARVPQVLVIKE